MTRRLIIIISLCLFLINSPLYSFAKQNKIRPYEIPMSSGKIPNSSAQNDMAKKLSDHEPAAGSETRKKMGPVLNNFLAGTGNASVTKTGLNKDRIRLIVDTAEDSTPVFDAVSKYDARILNKFDGMMALEVNVDTLEKMINETKAIKSARLPMNLFPMAVTSEGANLIGINNYHIAGHTGAGVRVAVIDVGFKGLSQAYRNGDIPYGVRTYDLTGNGIETEYYHGTACAEIIHEMAPGAELYLIKVYDEIDIYHAVDYCIDNKIDIISFSLGAFGTGPGNGTGTMDEYFNKAKENGILVVAAAGNFSTYKSDGYTFGGHWEGEFNDSDNDGIHEFIQADPDSEYNVIAAQPARNDDGESETGEVSILMRWNDSWSGSSIDYDIYLYEYDYDNDEIGNRVGYSTVIQNGFQSPVERIVFNLDDNLDAQYYALVVKKKTGESAVTEIEIYLGGTSVFIPFNGSTSALATSESSITEPADSESVLAVGAIYHENWEEGPQEDFSSQGPTNAWSVSSARIKPDICGPDGITTYTFGVESFFGTSASTPLAAGAAALIKSAHPEFGPEALFSDMETNAQDLGDAGKDNLYGWGGINLILDSGSIDPDQDNDGLPDAWENRYGFDTSLNDSAEDPDNDGYTNLMEYTSKTNPMDADTDDDGISDGDEDSDKDGILDAGETLPTRTDSDDDWVQDGTEQGVTQGVSDPDGAGPLSGTDTTVFMPDADPSTTTDPVDEDTDGDGIKDGEEDINHNGRVDSGETDPNVPNSTDGNEDDGDGDGGGCFIATAAYGSNMEPHVMVLRQFRDRTLLKSRLGSAIVGLYYRYSPPAADFISKHSIPRIITQWVLLPITWWCRLTFLVGLKPALFILAFFCTLICVTPIIWLKRKGFRHVKKTAPNFR